MLLKSKISNIEIGRDEWIAARLGKFTASKIHLLMGVKGLGKEGMSYIRDKVGEDLTGVSADKEYENDAMRWGIHYEREAINKFGLLKGIEFLVVQKLIRDVDSRFGCTPDSLWIRKESIDELSYEVSCAEAKCYPSFNHHIQMAECETPEQIKSVNPQVYWQVIMQMDECDCLKGYAIFYHPKFKFGGLRVIEFRKINLVEDFKFLKQRQQEAVKIFNETRERLINIKNAA